MPDILIIGGKDIEVARFSKVSKAEGFRVKHTDDISSASSLIMTRPFDLVLAAGTYSDKAIEDLSSSLWVSNNNAQFAVYSFDDIDPIEISRKRWSLGVLGVELFCGADTLTEIGKLIRKLGQRKQRSGAKFRVMVVEDLASPRDIICAFIEHLEYAFVKGFASPIVALENLNAYPEEYSCVITDVSMPNMTGWELTEQIRANEKLKNIPIIVLTAYGTPDILIKCLRAGASGFLVKPPSKAHLSRELSRAKRIIFNKEDPRLIRAEDMAVVEEILEEKGYL